MPVPSVSVRPLVQALKAAEVLLKGDNDGEEEALASAPEAECCEIQ